MSEILIFHEEVKLPEVNVSIRRNKIQRARAQWPFNFNMFFSDLLCAPQDGAVEFTFNFEHTHKLSGHPHIGNIQTM